MNTSQIHRLHRRFTLLLAAHKRLRGALRTWTEYELTVTAVDRLLAEIWHNQEVPE